MRPRPDRARWHASWRNCAGIFFGCVAQRVEGTVHRAVGRILWVTASQVPFTAVKSSWGRNGVTMFED